MDITEIVEQSLSKRNAFAAAIIAAIVIAFGIVFFTFASSASAAETEQERSSFVSVASTVSGSGGIG